MICNCQTSPNSILPLHLVCSVQASVKLSSEYSSFVHGKHHSRILFMRSSCIFIGRSFLICSALVLCGCLCNLAIGQRHTQIFSFIRRLGQLLGPLHISASSSCWINRRKAANASHFPHLRSCACVYLFHAVSLWRTRRLAAALN